MLLTPAQVDGLRPDGEGEVPILLGLADDHGHQGVHQAVQVLRAVAAVQGVHQGHVVLLGQAGHPARVHGGGGAAAAGGGRGGGGRDGEVVLEMGVAVAAGVADQHGDEARGSVAVFLRRLQPTVHGTQSPHYLSLQYMTHSHRTISAYST